MRFERGGQFWEIEQRGATLVTRAGRIGTRGRGEEAAHRSREEAASAHDRAIREKLREGYSAVSAPAPARPPADHAELTAAICARRGDPGAYQVYADWLIAQGHPFGELVVLMQQREAQARPEGRGDERTDTKAARKAERRAEERIDELTAQVGLPLPDRATYGWRHGLWSWLRINNAHDGRARTPFDPLEEGRAALEHPACAALEELRIGSLVWRSNGELVPRLLRAAGGRPWARHLERLRIGDFDPGIRRILDMHQAAYEWELPGVGALVSHAFPALRSLHLHTPGRGLDPFALPRLTELVIEGKRLLAGHLEGLVASELPVLERLVLPLEQVRLDPRVERDVRALLSGEDFPALRCLGLATADALELVGDLAASPLGARLERLELSAPELHDEHAAELAAVLRRLPRLAALVVEGGRDWTAHGRGVLEGAVPCQVWRADDPRLHFAGP